MYQGGVWMHCIIKIWLLIVSVVPSRRFSWCPSLGGSAGVPLLVVQLGSLSWRLPQTAQQLPLSRWHRPFSVSTQLCFNDPQTSNQRMRRVCMRFSLCQAGWWGGTQCMGDKHRIMVWPISFPIALLGHYHRNGPVGLLGYMQEYARTLLSTLDIYEILCIFLKCGLV